MINYYKNINGLLTEIDSYSKGCWISCVEPKEDEINYIIDEFNIEPEFLRASLDEEETSHIDKEDNATLIIIDIPVVEKHEKSVRYVTIPLGIMITENDVITVCLRDTPVTAEIGDGIIKNANPEFKTQFVLYIMLRMAIKYLQYLKQIDKISDHVERELRKSMRNKELIDLLEVEKSLVYFSSSLKPVEVTLEKIMRGRAIRLYEEDQDLLEDVLIEVKQAIEMSNIYLNILSGTMDTFASMISNNLNIVMKILASITLIISIPTVISGIYGMNTPNFPMMGYWWFPVILAIVLMGISTILLKKWKML